MSKSLALIERRKKVLPNGLSMLFQATADKGSNGVVMDLDGNELIDFAGGLGAINSGHAPKIVAQAIAQQAHKLIHASIQVATYTPYIELAEKLIELFPLADQTKVLLSNSGAEAVENAIKIAKQATKRQAIICFTGAAHGRTHLAMSLSSKVTDKIDCGPFAPEVYRLPYPNFYRYGDGLTEAQFAKREMARLRESLQNVVDVNNVAAIIIEVVQGKGGFYVCPPNYLHELRKTCYETGILLILDEIQSGMTRTGKWAAYQHFNIVPDMVLLGKSLAAGMPLSAIVGKAEIMDKAQIETLGGTFSGNPVCCAAAIANIQYMEELDLNAKAMLIGKIIRTHFEDLRKKCPAVGDVRGLGAMLAFELVQEHNPMKPDAALTNRLIKSCIDRGVLLLGAGTHKNIIRMLCPLTISEEKLVQGLRIIEEELLKEFAAMY